MLCSNFRDPFVLFSGGTCSSKKKGLTLMQGSRSLRVLCTDTVIDFVCITSTPWGEGKDSLAIKSWSVYIILYQGYKGDYSVTVIMHPIEIKCHSIIYMYTLILLQIVMVSPQTHLVKNHESKSSTNWVPVQKTISSTCKLKMLGPLFIQTVKLKTDSKTLFYSILKLI